MDTAASHTLPGSTLIDRFGYRESCRRSGFAAVVELHSRGTPTTTRWQIVVLIEPVTEVQMAMIENVTPILRVEDIEASRRYYIQTLGFSLDWDADGTISVSRDGKSIMLCEGEQGQSGTWLWIGVEDADAFFAEFSKNGAHIRSPPQNLSWAYEFEVEDPDGHVLRIGSEPKSV
jgi:predicted lactoylglutathione lyase